LTGKTFDGIAIQNFMSLPTVRTLLFFLLCLLPLTFLHAQDTIPGNDNGPDAAVPREYFLGFNVRYYPYQSFSQTKPSIPMKGGYPSFLADVVAFELQGELTGGRLEHYFQATYSLPSDVTSDNGFGSNVLLRPRSSEFSRFQFLYFFRLPLFSWGQLDASHGLSATVLYESRELTFTSGIRESQWDVNPGLGPNLSFTLPLGGMVDFVGQGHFLFYIPYMSYGEWESQAPNQEAVFSRYYSFIYAAHWDLQFRVNPGRPFQLQLGYRKTDQVGFGNSRPSFSLDEMVTYKLERFHEFYFGAVIKIGGRI
jgi:hypothetical protein